MSDEFDDTDDVDAELEVREAIIAAHAKGRESALTQFYAAIGRQVASQHFPELIKTTEPSTNGHASAPTPEQALLLATLDHRIAALESGTPDDDGSGDVLQSLWDDPDALRAILSSPHGVGATGEDDDGAEFEKAWNPDLHPKGKDGRFISRERINEAKSNAALAAELREEVKPADAQKLDDALAGKTDTGRTVRGVKKDATTAKRAKQTATRSEAKRLATQLMLNRHAPSVHDLRDLAHHLQSGDLRVAELRDIRLKLGAKFGGGRKMADMVDKLTAHVARQVNELAPPEASKYNQKSKGSESILQLVQDYGGIDPDSHELKTNYENMQRAKQDGIPIKAFRTGGRGLDQIARELEANGHISVPDDVHPGTHVLDLLREKAHSLHADLTKKHERALDDYWRTREEAESRHTPAEVESTVRSGAEAGRDEATEDPYGEHDQGVNAEPARELEPWDEGYVPPVADDTPTDPYDNTLIDHRHKLIDIPPNESGYVGGHLIRRRQDGSYQVETGKGYRVGTLDDMNDHIQEAWQKQTSERKAVDKALERATTHEDADPFTDPDGAKAEHDRRKGVPDGARAVSLDDATRGRVGKVVRDPATGAARLILDGGEETKASNFEPLAASHSWRTPFVKQEAAKRAVQGDLFADEPASESLPAPVPKTPSGMDAYTREKEKSAVADAKAKFKAEPAVESVPESPAVPSSPSRAPEPASESLPPPTAPAPAPQPRRLRGPSDYAPPSDDEFAAASQPYRPAPVPQASGVASESLPPTAEPDHSSPHGTAGAAGAANAIRDQLASGALKSEVGLRGVVDNHLGVPQADRPTLDAVAKELGHDDWNHLLAQKSGANFRDWQSDAKRERARQGQAKPASESLPVPAPTESEDDAVEESPEEQQRRDVARQASDRTSAAVSAAMKRAESEAKSKEEAFTHDPKVKLSERDQKSIYNMASHGRVAAAKKDAATRETINQYRSMSPEERASLDTAARDFFRRTYREHGDKYGTANDLHPDDAKMFGVKQESGKSALDKTPLVGDTTPTAPTPGADREGEKVNDTPATAASESLPPAAPSSPSPLTGKQRERAKARIAELDTHIEQLQNALDSGVFGGANKGEKKRRLKVATEQRDSWQAKLKGESPIASESLPINSNSPPIAQGDSDASVLGNGSRVQSDASRDANLGTEGTKPADGAGVSGLQQGETGGRSGSDSGNVAGVNGSGSGERKSSGDVNRPEHLRGVKSGSPEAAAIDAAFRSGELSQTESGKWAMGPLTSDTAAEVYRASKSNAAPQKRPSRQAALAAIAQDIAEHGRIGKHGLSTMIDAGVRVGSQTYKDAVAAGIRMRDARANGAASESLPPHDDTPHIDAGRAAGKLQLSGFPVGMGRPASDAVRALATSDEKDSGDFTRPQNQLKQMVDSGYATLSGDRLTLNPSADFGRADPKITERVKAAFDKHAKANNLVGLEKIRAELPDVPLKQIHASVQQMRKDGTHTLNSEERVHGVTPEQDAAAIREESSHLLNLSRRSTGTPPPLTGSKAASAPPAALSPDALAADPGADRRTLAVLASQHAPGSPAREHFEDALHNMTGENFDAPGVTGHAGQDRRFQTAARLAAAYRNAHDSGDTASAGHLATALQHFGATLHGPAAGETVPFTARHYDSDTPMLDGPATVHQQPVIVLTAKGEYVAAKGKAGPVANSAKYALDKSTVVGNTTPSAAPVTPTGSTTEGKTMKADTSKLSPKESDRLERLLASSIPDSFTGGVDQTDFGADLLDRVEDGTADLADVKKVRDWHAAYASHFSPNQNHQAWATTRELDNLISKMEK